MKKPVNQRSMFVASVGVPDSKGILSMVEDDAEDGFEDRRPDNIEIIANNLRGDMRSLDERYLELAQMVGESAFDTPEEVLALMQPMLQQQGAVPPQMPPQGAMPQQGMPGGIESLVAEPMPVKRQGGSPPRGETPIPRYGADFQRQLSQAFGTRASMPTAEYNAVLSRLSGLNPPAASTVPPAANMPRYGAAFQSAVNQAFGGAKTMPINQYNALLSQLSGVAGQANPNVAPGLLSAEGAAAQAAMQRGPGALPQQISPFLRLQTMAAEGMRNLPASAREGARVLMGTPQGRAAGMLGLAGATAIGMMGGQEEPGVKSVEELLIERGYSPEDARRLRDIPGILDQPPPVSEKYPEEFERGIKPAPGVVPALSPEQEEQVEVAKQETKVQTGEVPGTRPKDLKERMKERLDIYKDLLGDDENMRQAQALFVLAEGALNVAQSRGRSVGERLAKGLKGVPSAFGALAADKSRADMALRTAALSAAEQEMRDESKYAASMYAQMLKLQGQNADLATQAKYLVEAHGMSLPRATELARLMSKDFIKYDDTTGDLRDKTGKLVWSPVQPLQDGDVGFIPENAPFVTVGKGRLSPLAPKERGDAISRKRANQELVMDIEKLFADPGFESMYGPLAKIQSGLTTLTVPFIGETAFTNVQKQQLRNVAQELNNQLLQLSARNSSRPSVWEQKEVSKFLNDPDAVLNSPEQAFAVLNNFRVKALNEVNRIDHQLNPDQVPLKQYEVVPLGTQNDPVRAKDIRYLVDFFQLRPSASVYVQVPGASGPEKLTAAEFFAQFPNLRPQ